MNIASIMSKVLPGTFAPDLSASEAPAISPIPGLNDAMRSTAVPAIGGVGAVPSVGGETSFKDTVKQMLADVNDKLQTSDANTRDLASGKTNDLNKVITSVEEANLSLQYTMAIRTKLLDAYSEIDRLSI